jgi:hypothetical protein
MSNPEKVSQEEKYPIRDEWEEYYKVLEGIRRTGVCNMWGASPYLKEFCPELGEELSKEILLNWITNYNKLSEKYGWRN